MASPRHHFSPDVSPLDAEFEMQRAGVGEKRKSPSGARSPRLESDSSTIKSPKISDGHRRKMEKRRQLQEKLRRQVIASKTSVPEFEDIYFDLAATTQGMFDEWARPTKQFAVRMQRSTSLLKSPTRHAHLTPLWTLRRVSTVVVSGKLDYLGWLWSTRICWSSGPIINRQRLVSKRNNMKLCSLTITITGIPRLSVSSF